MRKKNSLLVLLDPPPSRICFGFFDDFYLYGILTKSFEKNPKNNFFIFWNFDHNYQNIFSKEIIKSLIYRKFSRKNLEEKYFSYTSLLFII